MSEMSKKLLKEIHFICRIDEVVRQRCHSTLEATLLREQITQGHE